MGNNVIVVAMGAISEVSQEPMTFDIYEDGFKFGAKYSLTDLQIARAVLLDLADAVAEKIKYMKN